MVPGYPKWYSSHRTTCSCKGGENILFTVHAVVLNSFSLNFLGFQEGWVRCKSRMTKPSNLGFGSCPWHPGTFKGGLQVVVAIWAKVKSLHNCFFTKDGWRKPGRPRVFFWILWRLFFLGEKFRLHLGMVEAPKTPAVGLKIFSARSRGSLSHLNRQRMRPVGSLHVGFLNKSIRFSWHIDLHPGRLTWNLLITHLERKMIFQTSMIMFHVNLPGCILCPFAVQMMSRRPTGSSIQLWIVA